MLTVKFETTNAAFCDGNASAECARILRNIAARIENTRDGSGTVKDSNGNSIGHWSLAVSADQE
jgi:hypothetical protein